MALRRIENQERDASILALRGTMKQADIADKLNTTKGVVSGVCFRAIRPRRNPSREGSIKRNITIPIALHDEITAFAALTNTSFSQICRDGARRTMDAAKEASLALAGSQPEPEPMNGGSHTDRENWQGHPT